MRRVVQPQIVGHKSKPTSQTEEYKEGQLGQSNDQVLTAAAAASAAVAATQPFLKVSLLSPRGSRRDIVLAWSVGPSIFFCPSGTIF